MEYEAPEAKRNRLLNELVDICYEDPSFFIRIVEKYNAAIHQKALQERERASDMEAIAFGMFSLANEKRKTLQLMNWVGSLIDVKIKKWEKFHSIEWRQLK